MKTIWCLLLLALPAVLLAAPYTLGPEDVLAVNVLRHPELSLPVTVLADGTINYPVVGQVQLAGLTTEQAAALLAAGLKKELLDPLVAVVVTTPRPRRIYVNGEVGKPGIYDWKEGWRLSEALAAAGGLTIKPELARASIFRTGAAPLEANLQDLYLAALPEANLPVQPEDTITVISQTYRIFVTGQVKVPGMYDLPMGAGVRQAVALAGGLTPVAAGSRSYVMRAGSKLLVNLVEVMERGNAAGDLEMQPGDTLHVPENRDSLAVFGHVNKPGYYPINDGTRITLAEAVSMAGGTDELANSQRVLLVRESTGGKPSLQAINLHAIMVEGKVEQNVLVQPSDIVFVTGKRPFRNSDLATAMSGVSLIRLLGLGF